MHEDDPLQVYLTELSEVRPLTFEQEIALEGHLRAHDAEADIAGRRLIEANLSMVVAIAEKYRPSGVDVLDLVQRGNNGLLAALKTFPENDKDRFAAHAARCIERAISEAAGQSQRQRD